MLEYICGEVSELTPTLAVIDCQGIGYGLNISLTTYSALAVGQKARLYVYEAIREDAYVLYGFIDRRERELFLLLISVSGVGPNTARMILSSLSPAELEQTISAEKVNDLKAVKGIGGKTAERIIVDLKDKIKKGSDTLLISHTSQQQEAQDEAIAALVMLGFSQVASQKAVQKAVKDNPTQKVETLIKAALKML
ncbi:MAG: Holliday junction branch migration protein RuvA [Porphyromonadaceae bacterium]|nr:Holliday junction branch migration protein RuvA [Porphyromonadaceae bacterium]